MVKKLAILLGVVFILLGVAGFIPCLLTEGRLGDVFRVNFEHNIAHLATGILLLLGGLYSSTAAKTVFVIFGIVYAVLALMGFFTADPMLFGMIATNTADHWLHTGIAIVFLYVGFKCKK